MDLMTVATFQASPPLPYIHLHVQRLLLPISQRSFRNRTKLYNKARRIYFNVFYLHFSLQNVPFATLSNFGTVEILPGTAFLLSVFTANDVGAYVHLLPLFTPFSFCPEITPPVEHKRLPVSGHWKGRVCLQRNAMGQS